MNPAALVFPRPFGRYTVLGEIGRGSMGVVYEARSTGRSLALKVLRLGLGMDRQGIERFRREAEVAASVPHAHIVGTIDAGEVDGEVYFTMPLLPGASVGSLVDAIREAGDAGGAGAHAVLDRHGFPAARHATPLAYARRVAGALAGVADALQALHDRGMVHRDVKPSNLMLDGAGRILLADFGLVRLQGQRLTETGQILGTLLYMSPEQLLAGHAEIDGRADVYSLGATLFELLTLRPPLQGRDARETIGLILKNRPPSVRALVPELPREIDAIVKRTLEKEPAARYATAAELRDDLAAFAEGRDVQAKRRGLLRRMWEGVRGP